MFGTDYVTPAAWKILERGSRDLTKLLQADYLSLQGSLDVHDLWSQVIP
jgi:hypothetical protein